MKIRKAVVREIIGLFGLIVVLGVAVVFDHWLAVWRVEAGSSFDFSKAMPAMTWTRLIMAGLLLLLAWYVLVRTLPGPITSVLFIIIGLFVTFMPSLLFIAQWSLVRGLMRTGWSNGFGYLLLDTGAMIAMIGFIALNKIGWNLLQKRIWGETAVTTPMPE